MNNLANKIIAENINIDICEVVPSVVRDYQKKTEKIINRALHMISARLGNTEERKELLDKFINDRTDLFVSRKLFEEIYSFAEAQHESVLKGKLIKPDELESETLDFYDNGYEAGIKIPAWPTFSSHFRMAKSEMTVFTGIPGHGKSEFTDMLMIFLSGFHDWKFAVFSPENFPHAIHNEKLLSKVVNMPFHEGTTKRMERQTVINGLKTLSRNITYISPDSGYIGLEGVLALATIAKEKSGLDCLIIDPWNSIENDRPSDKSETEYLGQCLNHCRDFARRNEIALWIVAHPTKMQKEKDSDKYKVPQAYDISGSANWANKCDNVICIYRTSEVFGDMVIPFVEVHIQKVKYKMRGMTGKVEFEYDRITGTYKERGDR